MWFEDWDQVARVLMIGPAAYLLLVAMLRISGKRTLAKFNAFDLVVTVAMGSTLSSALLSPSATLAQAAAAFLVLVGGQYLIARLAVAWPWFDRAIKAEPTLLALDGRLLRQAMRRERITEGEVMAALRDASVARLQDAGAVVLESDGSLTVLPRREPAPDSTLRGVAGRDAA